jgi:hypothetical protein
MSLQIITCDQGTPEWFAARLGIPTASEFSTVMAQGKGGSPSLTRKTYMMKLAGERLTGEPMDSYSNGHMERGKEWEAEARERYAFEREAEPEIVGFIRNGEMGASPDSLVGGSGLLEIKTKAAHLQVELLTKGPDYFPPEFKAQTQGQLMVAEREWVDLGVYCRKLPLFLVRAVRDEPYIANMRGEIDRFNDELAELVENVRRYGAREALAA